MMPGTGCASLIDTVELTQHAEAQGCRGVLMLPPFYYKAPSDDGLFAYFSEVIHRVGGGIAIYLYHFPQQSAVPFSLDLIGRLLKAYPGPDQGREGQHGDYANMKAMVDAFARMGSRSIRAPTNSCRDPRRGWRGLHHGGGQRQCALGAPRLCAAHGPEADAAQAVLTATRRRPRPRAADPRPARDHRALTGDSGWRNIRPPHLPLWPRQGRRSWDDMQAAGALPLPGLAPVSRAAE